MAQEINKDELAERVKEIKRSKDPSKLQAIKLVKDLTDWGIKESKEFVDKHWC